MQKEYTKRYGISFQSIFHADDPLRFENVTPQRLTKENIFSIVTIGTFDKFRWPLIDDINQSCEILHQKGVSAQLSVISNAIDKKGYSELKKMNHVKLYEDPGSDYLPKLLKGADLLVLIETFDYNRAKAIELSISTKAHLFMYSKVPILVYGSPLTGIVNYALKYNWAYVLTERSHEKLTKCLIDLHYDYDLRQKLIDKAYMVALENHNLSKIEKDFFEILQ